MARKPLIANAWLDPGLTMRVGVPHFNGALPAHCSEAAMPVMISAGAYWRARRGAFVEPSQFGWSSDACDVALDSAGYVAMRQWSERGQQRGMCGVYPWTLQQYLALVNDVRPRWWSAPDACVEPAVAPDSAAVKMRCDLTITLLEQTLVSAAAVCSQTGGDFRPPVPVVQGWTADQYRASLDRVQSAWDLFTAGTRFERSPTLIGVGSVCRRDLHHPQHGVWRVLDAIAHRIPEGSRLHLFGVKGDAVRDLQRHFPMVASVDSMAWDFSARMAACHAKRSNTMENRIGHMDRWVHRHGVERASNPPQQHLFS